MCSVGVSLSILILIKTDLTASRKIICTLYKSFLKQKVEHQGFPTFKKKLHLSLGVKVIVLDFKNK